MKKTKLLTMIFVALMVVSMVLVGCGTSETTAPPTTDGETVTLVRGVIFPSTQVREIGLEWPYWQELEKRSNGRIKIENYYSHALAAIPETYNSAVTGLADIAECPYASIAGKFPLQEMFSVPDFSTLTNRPNYIQAQLYKEFPQFLEQLSETHNLFPWSESWETFFLVEPVTDLESIKGRVISGSGWMAKRAAGLGFVPTQVLQGEVYSALDTGVIEGNAGNGWLVQVSWKWIEKNHYMLVMGLKYMTAFNVMNKDKWNSLPSDLQKIIDDWANDPNRVDLWDTGTWQTNEEARKTSHEDYDVTEITLSEEELQKWLDADAPVREEFVDFLDSEGFPGQAMFDRYYELLHENDVRDDYE